MPSKVCVCVRSPSLPIAHRDHLREEQCVALQGWQEVRVLPGHCEAELKGTPHHHYDASHAIIVKSGAMVGMVCPIRRGILKLC